MSENKENNTESNETQKDDITQKKHDYDARAKKLLSNKEVIANILKYAVKEFKDLSIPEIISCLNGEPEISAELVDDPCIPPNMDVSGSETVSENDGKRTFDIKFRIGVPNQNIEIELIINIEAQGNYYPGYIIERRGVYYISRMISSQYNVDFSGSDFDKMKKVYSIWICTDTPKNVANTITEYSLTPKSIVGKVPDIPFRYDLMSLIIINLGSSEENYSGLIKMLDLLLNKIVSDREKALNTLKNEFNISLDSIDKEVNSMCNLSENIYQKGINDGKIEGRMEGKIEGKIQMIKALVKEQGMKLETALSIANIDKETFIKYSDVM